MSQPAPVPSILCASFSHWPDNADDTEALLSAMLPTIYFQQDLDVRVIAPAHPHLLSQLSDIQPVTTLHLVGTTEPLQISLGRNSQGVPIYLAELPGIEKTALNSGKSTLAIQNYALFARAVIALANNKAGLNWQASIVHHTGWQTGLVSALMHYEGEEAAKTLFTLSREPEHRCVEEHIYRTLYLPSQLLTEAGILIDREACFLKAAILHADMLVLRSAGLDEAIRNTPNQSKLSLMMESRQGPVSAITHGINRTLWNPATDPHIIQQYDAASIELKKINKLRLQQRLGLEEDERVLLLGFCGPISQDSGIAHILNTLPDLRHEENIKLVVHAWGDRESEQHLLNQQETYPEILSVLLGNSEEDYHQVIASSDCLLLPGEFASSGEHSVVALTYGTVPIATDSGVNRDYIVDTTARTSLNGSANGFIYPADRPSALLDAIRRVKSFHVKPGVWWEKLASTCMHHPFEGDKTAIEYIKLYSQVLQS